MITFSETGKLVWVTNAPARITSMEIQNYGHTPQTYAAWRAQFVELDPQATEAHTVKELTAMGLVGLYRVERA